jgi:hypothetical protein
MRRDSWSCAQPPTWRTSGFGIKVPVLNPLPGGPVDLVSRFQCSIPYLEDQWIWYQGSSAQPPTWRTSGFGIKVPVLNPLPGGPVDLVSRFQCSIPYLEGQWIWYQGSSPLDQLPTKAYEP